MKIRKKLLIDLRKVLPIGSAKDIQARLKKQNKGLFSVGYIYRVLDPDNDDYNTIIIEEAVNLLEELNRKKKEIEQRILEAVK